MKILVTGGAGFIGSHIADRFASLGHEVVVVDNLSSGVRKNVDPKAEFVELDIRDDAFSKLVKSGGFDVINHHAAHIHVGRSVEDPLFDAENNVMATIRMMEAAKSSGSVKHVIFAATGGAMYGERETPFDESMIPQPLSPYGISKRACELYLNFYYTQHSISYTSLRYANVYGPRQNPHGEAGVISIFFEKLKADEVPTINGDGKQTRDYVYVGDVVDANQLALEKQPVGEFNVGTTIETDVNDIYKLVAGAADSSVMATHGPARPGEQQTSSLDYSKIEKALGWKPRVDLRQGIRETAAFFLS